MQSSLQLRPQADERDWALFTSLVLLVSSASRIAREELDALIIAGTRGNYDAAELRRARSGVAALASISDHYTEGDCL